MESFPERLKAIGLKKSSPEVFDAVTELITALRVRDMTEEDLKLTLEIISYGFEEINSFNIFDGNLWMDFDYGNTKPGDYVKVKDNSYDSPTGTNHNGRVGRITNISGRRVHVRYLGTSRVSDMTHPISHLQSPKHGLQLNTK